MAGDEMLEKLGESLGSKATVKSVFGEPIQAAGKTIIPVAKVFYGFGGGFGAGPQIRRRTGAPKAKAAAVVEGFGRFPQAPSKSRLEIHDSSSSRTRAGCWPPSAWELSRVRCFFGGSTNWYRCVRESRDRSSRSTPASECAKLPQPAALLCRSSPRLRARSSSDRPRPPRTGGHHRRRIFSVVKNGQETSTPSRALCRAACGPSRLTRAPSSRCSSRGRP